LQQPADRGGLFLFKNAKSGTSFCRNSDKIFLKKDL